MTPDPNITQLLAHVQNGDREAETQLMEAVYEELHRLAAGYMRRERPDHTLQASALVNEAYVRLIGNGPVSWESRACATSPTFIRRHMKQFVETTSSSPTTQNVRE